MKKLILVRHGKSSWEHNVQDPERPLKKRAFKDAALVLSAFKSTMGKPNMIWTSFATRALESAKIFREELEVEDKNFIVKEDLYTFSSEKLKGIIESCDDGMEELMIFGHNPAITETVNQLGNIYFENIPTTGLTIIEFDTHTWKKLEKGKTLVYLFPKNLR